MLNFMIFLYLRRFKISFSAEFSMKFFITSGPGPENYRILLETHMTHIVGLASGVDETISTLYAE